MGTGCAREALTGAVVSPAHASGASPMPRPVGSLALLAAIVAVTLAPAGAHAHDWYSGLHSPSGELCCNARDCRPVPYRTNPATGREEIRANGAWHPIEYDKVLPLAPPDGGFHACWSNPTGTPRFRCIILPGMAALEPPGLLTPGTAVVAR